MTTPTSADKAISSLRAIPFYNVIAGPLNACVQAQAEAAVSTVNFIQSVGLNQKEGEPSEAVYVSFSFIQGGRKACMQVPLLAIVPIPYIAINSIDISFKAVVTGVESSGLEDTLSNSISIEKNQSTKKGGGWITTKKTTNMNTQISSKRDSKATQDSSYSIEATIDVNVHAGQDSMPAGMARVLEMLNSSVDLFNPDGELTVSENQLYLKNEETAVITISYRDKAGLLDPEKIEIAGGDTSKVINSMKVLTIVGGSADQTITVKVKDSTPELKETINVKCIK